MTRNEFFCRLNVQVDEMIRGGDIAMPSWERIVVEHAERVITSATFSSRVEHGQSMRSTYEYEVACMLDAISSILRYTFEIHISQISFSEASKNERFKFFEKFANRCWQDEIIASIEPLVRLGMDYRRLVGDEANFYGILDLLDAVDRVIRNARMEAQNF